MSSVAKVTTSSNLVMDELDPSVIFPFQLDEFQIQAIDALNQGHSVVVSAPTGSGKVQDGFLDDSRNYTVFVEVVMEGGVIGRSEYLNPIKPGEPPVRIFPNQKFGEMIIYDGTNWTRCESNT